jgi:hypothetical protein
MVLRAVFFGVLLGDTFSHNEAGEARSDLFDTTLKGN